MSDNIDLYDIAAFDDPEIGRRLKSLRSALGHTQSAVAKALGVSQSFVSKIEKDPGNTPFGLISDYCAFLGVTPRQLTQDGWATIPEKKAAGIKPARLGKTLPAAQKAHPVRD